MPHTETVDDFKSLFLNQTPLIDLRAPIEFTQGTFSSSVNLPLMNDEERKAVGTCYKQESADAAVKLGHQLVSGCIKTQRVNAWVEHYKHNPDLVIYCFRGGQRSRISQQWLKEAGVECKYVQGGYKALRNYLLEQIEIAAQKPMTIIAGNTGSGKTTLINQVAQGVDLEGFANHRGSSFGRYVTEQPTQINFENNLAVELLKKEDAGFSQLIIEDEGRNIGALHLPHSIYKAMQSAPVMVIADPLDIRLERLLDDYVIRMQHDFIALSGEEQGWQQFSDYLKSGISGIKRRLGVERHDTLIKNIDSAVHIHQATGSIDGHLGWLEPLLSEYYDPMYQYQLSRKAERVIFTGDYQQVKAECHLLG
ncbi:tRNA 2-selenouridine(34) synthase MnmH [Vibrio sp. SS-MA-C1-2]|uniref:tRNA 2-selenouridine(34) synthase MnmH n=1 Tax=Vibrio sp. SS-MA-C1-2 TaxID=2908646 RepID=UPI001F3BC9FE|nr:tRNA 2-selenouridine(34) synthase MnmH [Vibrio sp. SS-MA-C1-2]UJF19858.1 tRNA 2-selenouridine(34) synthase MnmH [Vibrio sp. SS-MA-C1-2]